MLWLLIVPAVLVYLVIVMAVLLGGLGGRRLSALELLILAPVLAVGFAVAAVVDVVARVARR